MSATTDVIYCYDGTLKGFYTCVFESFEKKERPTQILSQYPEQISFCTIREIVTDREKSRRVAASLPRKISQSVAEFVQLGFLTNHPEKELLLLDFIYKAFRCGPYILQRLTDDTVNTLDKAIRFLKSESHLLCGFVRFSLYDGIAVSIIHPKNFVLPVVKAHFCDRFADQNFMIYDETHHMALVHRPGEAEIIPLHRLELNAPSAEESRYRQLWKEFYDTIAIKERYNPKCRMSHMPQRYWQDMTEFQEHTHAPLHPSMQGAVATLPQMTFQHA